MVCLAAQLSECSESAGIAFPSAGCCAQAAQEQTDFPLICHPEFTSTSSYLVALEREIMIAHRNFSTTTLSLVSQCLPDDRLRVCHTHSVHSCLQEILVALLRSAAANLCVRRGLVTCIGLLLGMSPCSLCCEAAAADGCSALYCLQILSPVQWGTFCAVWKSVSLCTSMWCAPPAIIPCCAWRSSRCWLRQPSGSHCWRTHTRTIIYGLLMCSFAAMLS